MISISKNIVIGNCALCEQQNVQLRASHLIPKLAYVRTKSNKKSRFRAMNDIKHPLQDGEKKYLLCDACEKFFNVFETQFTNLFLDDFLKTKKLNRKCFKEDWFQNYVLSVSWRVLYDDLYNAGSFEGDSCRTIFEECEKSIRNYFKASMNNTSVTLPQCKHYVYKIEEIVANENAIKLLEPSLFGYCYFDGEYQLPMVISYYLGIVFVTVFDNADVLFIDSLRRTLMRKCCLSKIVKEIASKEVETEAIQMAVMYRNNMTPELFEKIKKYYVK